MARTGRGFPAHARAPWPGRNPYAIEFTDQFIWHVGGRVEFTDQLIWHVGGRVSFVDELQWAVAPPPNRVSDALTGVHGPVVYTFRFERRSKLYQYLADVTLAVIGGGGDLNNNRVVKRTATFSIDANAVDDSGAAVEIDPLADHIAVFMDLLVDGNYHLDLPMGLFALNVPRKTFTPGGHETWEVDAADSTIHLLESTTTSAWRVASGQNYITGTNAAAAILTTLGLPYALPATALTLPADKSWDPGTPWATVVNDLLAGAGMYHHWFDASGVCRSRHIDDMSQRTPDVTYTGEDYVLIPIVEEAETTRLANQVIAIVDDPNRAPLSSVATNADPSSPVSTVSLGRTITKVIRAEAAADQTTLDTIAQRALEESASLYRRGTLVTSIDPRRDAHEVYEVTVDGVYDAEKWWCQSWTVRFETGAQMTHTLGKVEAVAAS